MANSLQMHASSVDSTKKTELSPHSLPTTNPKGKNHRCECEIFVVNIVINR